jgi:hypothetical protein
MDREELTAAHRKRDVSIQMLALGEKKLPEN